MGSSAATVETEILWGEIFAQPDGAMVTEKRSGCKLAEVIIRPSLIKRLNHDKFAAGVKLITEALDMSGEELFTCEHCQQTAFPEGMVFTGNGIFCSASCRDEAEPATTG